MYLWNFWFCTFFFFFDEEIRDEKLSWPEFMYRLEPRCLESKSKFILLSLLPNDCQFWKMTYMFSGVSVSGIYFLSVLTNTTDNTQHLCAA